MPIGTTSEALENEPPMVGGDPGRRERGRRGRGGQGRGVKVWDDCGWPDNDDGGDLSAENNRERVGGISQARTSMISAGEKVGGGGYSHWQTGPHSPSPLYTVNIDDRDNIFYIVVVIFIVVAVPDG